MTDLEGRLAGYAAEGRRPRLPDADVSYGRYESELGAMVLAVADDRVVASSFEPEDVVAARLARRLSPRVLRQPHRLDPVRRQLDEFLSGRRSAFDITVDLALATPFQRSVLQALAASTPYGTTTSYGALARRIGRPAAARAVGTALRGNPCCVLVPCHRVVAAGGAASGYAGGTAAKEFLLRLERVSPSR